MRDQVRSDVWRYLLQEAALILLLGYALSLGGTYNGLVLANLRLVTTVLLGMIGAAWLIARWRRRWPFPHTALDVPLLVYFAVHVVTALTSSDPRRSFIYVWLLGAYMLLFYLFVDLLRHGWPSELFIKSLLIVSVIIVGFGVRELSLWYGAWHDIWGWTRLWPVVTTRVHAFLGHPNWVAAFLNLLWPLALTRLWTTRARVPRVLLGAWLAASVVLIYFTSSRGGWIGTGAAMAVLLILIGNTPPHGAKRLLVPMSTRQRWVHPSSVSWAQAQRVVGGLAVLGASALVILLLVMQLAHPTHGSFWEARRDLWGPALQAFLSSPWWGTGPFTYGETFLKNHSVPSEALFGVAHNYTFNLTAESGLLGLTALIWLTAALARGLWQAWRQVQAGEPAQGAAQSARMIWIGALAALASVAAHSFFDSIETVPALSLMIALVLAVCLSGPAQSQSPLRSPLGSTPFAKRSTLWTWGLTLGWVALLSSAVWSLVIYLDYSKGVLSANLGRVSEARPVIESAARRDPGLAVYQFQAGYVNGVLAAEGDSSALPAAMAYYQAGLASSRNYALNLANLGGLYQQAGDLDQALVWMQRAAELAPYSAVIALNLGRLYEQTGRVEAATRWYNETLDYAPEWAEAYLWRSSPVRAQAVAAWRAARVAPPAPVAAPRSLDEWLVAGQSALAEGRHAEALAAFERVLRQDPNRIPAYLGQAQAEQATGHVAQAEQALRTALMAEGGAPLDYLRLRFALGRLYRAQGLLSQAIASGEAALGDVRHPSVYGLGQQGASDYAWYLFYSDHILRDLLPQLTVITVTDEIAADMLELGAWYQEQGNPDRALQIYREALAAVPDLDEAQERILALKK